VSSLEPFEPGELEDFQKEQAGRIRGFLKRLATRDKLLLRYINDRVAVLREEVEKGRLTSEDVALLLDSDYTRVYEVMSQGSEPLRWIIIWII
jgi:hypothetical protein